MQEHTSMIIKNNINSENILAFLSGYYDTYDELFPSNTYGNPFFEQLIKEDGFDEKYDLMGNMANKLLRRLESSGCFPECRDVYSILQHKEFTVDDAKKLDKIAKNAIKYDF